jgi:cell division protein FtsL
MDLNCTYEFLNNQPKLTVGQLFQAHCQLPANSVVELGKLKIKPVTVAPKNYDVVFVKAAQAGDQLGLMLTSYTVGAKDIPNVVLTDEAQDYTIVSPIKFEVTSILKPEEKPEMFGPISGLGVVIPLFYWLLLAAVLFVLLTSAAVSAYARRKRRKLLKRLETLEDGTGALPQFFTSYRKLQRENAVFSARSRLESEADDELAQSPDDLFKLVKTVESSMRVFLARAFKVTQFEQSWKKIASELEDSHDLLFSVLGADLSELASEFQKAGVGKNKLEPKDALLISEKARKWIERADQLQAAIQAKDTQLIKRLRGAK